MKSMSLLISLVVLLSALSQAQKYNLETKHFDVVFPNSHRLSIWDGAGDDPDFGTGKETFRGRSYMYDTSDGDLMESVRVREIDHDIPLTQEVADYYGGTGAVGSTKKDSEGWVYTVVSRRTGHLNASANAVDKTGQWSTITYEQPWTYYEETYIDGDSKAPKFTRNWIIVVGKRTVIFVHQSGPRAQDSDANWNAFASTLKVKATVGGN
jgi:hypothetical protein